MANGKWKGWGRVGDFSFLSHPISDSLIGRQRKQKQQEKRLEGRYTKWLPLTAQRENDSEWLSRGEADLHETPRPGYEILKIVFLPSMKNEKVTARPKKTRPNKLNKMLVLLPCAFLYYQAINFQYVSLSCAYFLSFFLLFFLIFFFFLLTW